jgi:hypothetical protein
MEQLPRKSPRAAFGGEKWRESGGERGESRARVTEWGGYRTGSERGPTTISSAKK